MTWFVGPYLMFTAVAISILKTIHFIYYNSKKRIAQNVEHFLAEDDPDEDFFEAIREEK